MLKTYSFSYGLRDDRNWAAKLFCERADAITADQSVTYFFLRNYQEICRYMRVIGYGSKGKADTVEKQVARELAIGRYCSLRTTVRGRQSAQDIALFIYRDLATDHSGSGLVVVSYDTGGELAKQFADAWFRATDALVKEGLSKETTTNREPQWVPLPHPLWDNGRLPQRCPARSHEVWIAVLATRATILAFFKTLGRRANESTADTHRCGRFCAKTRLNPNKHCLPRR